MPYTFGGKLLGLGHLADNITFGDDSISIGVGPRWPYQHLPDISVLPSLTHHLTVIDVQRNRHVGLASAVGSPCGDGTPVSGSILNVVTLCDN